MNKEKTGKVFLAAGIVFLCVGITATVLYALLGITNLFKVEDQLISFKTVSFFSLSIVAFFGVHKAVLLSFIFILISRFMLTSKAGNRILFILLALIVLGHILLMSVVIPSYQQAKQKALQHQTR